MQFKICTKKRIDYQLILDKIYFVSNSLALIVF